MERKMLQLELLHDSTYQMHEMLVVRMHWLAVGECEIKFRLDSVGMANGACQMIIMNRTRHICIVHIN